MDVYVTLRYVFSLSVGFLGFRKSHLSYGWREVGSPSVIEIESSDNPYVFRNLSTFFSVSHGDDSSICL